MSKTSIEWTTDVWNPVTGCTKVSAGCKHCYAETIAGRFWAKQYQKVPDEGFGIPGAVNQLRTREFTDVLCHEDRLATPLRWQKPRRVFVNSMSDLFHDEVTEEFIDRVFAVMALTPQHTYQVLTKRPERMREYLEGQDAEGRKRSHVIGLESLVITLDNFSPRSLVGKGIRLVGDGELEHWPLPNIHLGVSVENQPAADERIPLLLQTPAAVRFLSVEPLLGPVDLTEHLLSPISTGHRWCETNAWVIVGGESGPGARPMDLKWARDIVAQCRAAGVACFVKQLGARPYETMGSTFRSDPKDILDIMVRAKESSPPAGCTRVHNHGRSALYRYHRLRNRKGSDWSEWPEDLRVRTFPDSNGAPTLGD